MATDAPLINLVAGEAHFADHLRPVWAELPRFRRGSFYVHRGFIDRFADLDGVKALPASGRLEALGFVVVAAIGDVSRAPGARIVLMEHGAGQSYSNRHSSYVGGVGRTNVELVLVPNDDAAGRHRRYYPRGPRVEAVGCPKVDAIVAAPPKPRSSPPVVAVSWHWHPRQAHSPEVGSAWPALGEPILDELQALDADGVIALLGHAHPRIADKVFEVYRARGIAIAESFDEVLARADLYAVDNSSTLFEFAATGRGVLVINAPQYRRIVHHGLRFWKAAGIGPHINGPADVAGAVALALEDGDALRASRKAGVALAYSVLDGTAARRAAMAILSSENVGAVAKAGRIPGAPTTKGPRVLKTYRTATGDFRLSPEAAIARGLLPSPSGLFPAPVARRLRRAGATTAVIEAIAGGYVKLDEAGQIDTLASYALTTDHALKGLMAEYVAEAEVAAPAPAGPVETPQPPDPPASESRPTDVVEEVLVGGEVPVPDGAVPEPPAPEAEEVDALVAAVKDGRVGDVIDVVAGDPDRARTALALERDARARPTLLAELERIIAGGE